MNNDKIFYILTLFSAVGVVGIAVYIAAEVSWIALPAIREFGYQFLISTEWNPVKGIYGILPQIYGTLVSSLLALLIAIPLGLGIAIFLSENFLPRKLLVIITFLVELLAAIPSVVYGLWGIFVLTPAIRPVLDFLYSQFNWIPLFSTAPSTRAILPTVVVLAIMILPIITAISRDTLVSLPPELRRDALALGATRWETIIYILIPAGISGIIGSGVLALGRALGETMVTTMLIGNANRINTSLLAPGSTIASLIANQFSEAKGLQISALLYAALVLMVLTFVVNSSAELIFYRFQSIANIIRYLKKLFIPVKKINKHFQVKLEHNYSEQKTQSQNIHNISSRNFSRKVFNITMTTIVLFSTFVTLLFLLSILYNVISNGITRLDVRVFTELPPPPLENAGGLRNAITGTLVVVSISTVLSVPLGMLTAIYTAEFGKNTVLTNLIRFITNILSGVPSIICGLFAYGVVVRNMESFSAIAGGVALAVLTLPIIIRTTEEALKLVPQELREGAIALSATNFQTIRLIVLPIALPTILTGVTLAWARAIGETAPLLFTTLFSQYDIKNIWSPVATLSVLIYNFAVASPYPNHQKLAWTAALMMIIIILITNVFSRLYTGKKYQVNIAKISTT
ncbi:MAG: phosphate ABC transporter permease subunit PstC [Calothrix sp. C42_A2020_038]|nr:phosphate ABC transporter permease subunit PstC [Calothrix sp. C42_A2020_038]